MELKNGDKIKFGIIYCNKSGRKNLMNKTIMLTPQEFEEDNGLYCYNSECAGIYNEEDEEADSIYHLFGNDLSEFYDCELIPATEDDLKLIQSMIDEKEKAIEQYYVGMADYFSKEIAE